MPKFSYTAVHPDGTASEGVNRAKSADLLIAAARKNDLEVVRLRAEKSIWQFEITRKHVSRKVLMHFSRQMAAFIRAGISILDALEVIRDETSDKLFRAALTDVMTLLQEGETFAGAAAAHPEAFPTFYAGILRSAEVTGHLDTALEQLSEYLERDIEARQRITSALVYPTVVLAMSVVTIIVLTTFVLPRFRTFFKSLNAKLPLPTRLLLSVTNILSDYWYVFIVLAVFVALLLALSSRTQRGRTVRDKLLLRLPGISELIRFAILERFCRIMSSMVTAGVPLPDALTITSDATNNAVFQRAITSVRDAMLRGEGLAAPVAATGLFPAAARQMFKVGEETGTLDEQLRATAVFFDRELEYRVKRFTSLFEPAVIILVGLVVGFVAIALVSAMYGIYHQVHVS